MCKSEIRSRILTIRDQLEPEVKTRYDKAIGERVLSHQVYQESQIILAYASYRSEVNTIPMIGRALADGKYVFAPKVAGAEMEFWQIRSLEDLRIGYKGIPEPVERVSFPEWINRPDGSESTEPALRQEQIPHQETVLYQEKDLCRKRQYRAVMWMPGAVFDRERHRLGYGKGFYDRYLGRLPDRAGFFLTTMALAFTCQLVNTLPCEAHDVKPDMVITEAGIL